ncbi:MAG: hypothetical protein GF384_03045 [Elusimicrobia bacterium]|nr:hypothetical protein [Elusimicrobiota bacterium]MBD3411913.1 hypothetical protein [Elusimicrobiota bacterium]
MNIFWDRIIRASKLDVSLYEEVEADPKTLGQAVWVVILSSVAAGIGGITTAGVNGIIFGTIGALIGWYVWATLTYFIGARLMPEPQTSSTIGELLRTIGFSSAPGLIRILAIIPGIANVVLAIAGIWMLIAMIIAVRQALDYRSTFRAAGVCLIGWLVQMLILYGLYYLMGSPI